MDLFRRNRYSNLTVVEDLMEVEENIEMYPERSLFDVKGRNNGEFYTKELVRVFQRMLEPDPERRATVEEIMRMDYFRRVRFLPKMYEMKEEKKKSGKKRRRKEDVKERKKIETKS